MNVSSILRRKGTQVETARAQMTVGQAAQRMAGKRIGSLLIVDEHGHLHGVLS